MNDPGIRRAEASDLPALRELASAFYREDGFDTAPQVLEANLAVLLDTGSAHVAVIDDVSQLLAFAITTTSFGLENGLIAELEDLYVTPAARGLRHGRRLLENSATWSRARGCSHLEIVIADGPEQQRLHNYYRRAGFTDPRVLLRQPLQEPTSTHSTRP